MQFGYAGSFADVLHGSQWKYCGAVVRGPGKRLEASAMATGDRVPSARFLFRGRELERVDPYRIEAARSGRGVGS
jgi:hypothetical protein